MLLFDGHGIQTDFTSFVSQDLTVLTLSPGCSPMSTDLDSTWMGGHAQVTEVSDCHLKAITYYL